MPNTTNAPLLAAATTPNPCKKGTFAKSKFVPTNPLDKTAIATPRLAPELIPRTYGSAKGFRKRVCICNPLTDNAAPAITAVKAFGRRKLIMIDFHVSRSDEFLKRISNTFLNGMFTEPNEIDRIKAVISDINKTKNTKRQRKRFEDVDVCDG